jgi:ATP-dependent helicase HrpA
MLEELRVSLFAQQLGTARPVSEQRVQRAIDRLSARGAT